MESHRDAVHRISARGELPANGVLFGFGLAGNLFDVVADLIGFPGPAGLVHQRCQSRQASLSVRMRPSRILLLDSNSLAQQLFRLVQISFTTCKDGEFERCTGGSDRIGVGAGFLLYQNLANQASA